MSSRNASRPSVIRRLAWYSPLALLLAAALAVAQAQEDTGAEPAVAAAEESAEAPAEAGPAEEAAAEEALPEQPEMPGVAPTGKMKDGDAEKMPKASKSLLLDLEDTGTGLIAVGERGHILLSQDGGLTWTQSKVPTRATLTAIDCADASTCWAVGHDAVILKTSDGGKTWAKQHFAPELEKPFIDVLFFDAQHGITIGAYGLFKETTDGGNSWNEFTADIRAEEWHFNAVTRLGNGNLLLVGETGGIATSTDGGVTWVQQESPYEGSYFGALPIGESGAVIYGLRGNAYMSADATKGGWTKIETGTLQGLLGGTLLSNGDFLIVGNNGTILRGAPTTGLVQEIRDPVGKGLSAAMGLPNGDLLVLGETGARILKGVVQ